MSGALLVVAVVGVVGLTVGTATGWISVQTVPTGSMEPTISRGSAIVVDPVAVADVVVGDVIVFAAPETARMTVHRVVEIQDQDGQRVFLTKGDANEAPDPWRLVPDGDHFHKVRMAVPGVGRLLLALSAPWSRMALAVVGAGAVLWFGLTQIWRRRPDDPQPATADQTWGPALERLAGGSDGGADPGPDPDAWLEPALDPTSSGHRSADDGHGPDDRPDDRPDASEGAGHDPAPPAADEGAFAVRSVRPHPRVRRLATSVGVVLVAGTVALAGVMATAPLPVAAAGFNATTSATGTVSTTTVPPKAAVACSWDTATAVTVSWSNPNATDAAQVLVAASSGAAPTVAATAPAGATDAPYAPPSPLTTVRYLSTRATRGTWMSVASPEMATDGCRRSVISFAGVGTNGFAGDGGAATAARLDTPIQTAEAPDGRVFLADSGNDRIRVVGTDGTITTFAGGATGALPACSWTGPVASLRLSAPEGVAVDAAGNVYIADTGRNCIRKVAPDGTVTQVAGGGATTGCAATTAATDLSLSGPSGLAIEPSGALVVADTGRDCVRRISAGTATRVAGGGGTSTCGTTTAAGVSLNGPTGVAVDASGDVLIADTLRNCVRRVSGTAVTRVAGGGTNTACGTTTTATISLSGPEGVAVAPDGSVYVSDTGRRCVRRISGSTVEPAAFTGANSSNGDGGPALGATARKPASLTVLADGDLLVSDRATNAGANDVRRIELS